VIKLGFIGFKYSQHSQEYISTVLPFRVILETSRVLVYGEDDYGYQRKTDKKHYMAIKKYLIKKESGILPTSVILSVNRSDLDKITSPNPCGENTVNLTIPTGKVFRIVDGQHRIKGLTEALKDDESFNNYPLNVIILITEPEKRVVEIEVFKDINSKAKKIKTDLTLLAEHNYRLLGQKSIDDNNKLVEHIGVKVAYCLNEEVKGSVWNHGIKIDIHADHSLGIIGISAFTNSIKNIVRKYVTENPFIGYDPIDYANKSSIEIAKFLNTAWDIVGKKWTKCFNERLEKDLYDLVSVFYNDSYYLQKTTGTNAIHLILMDTISDFGFSAQAINAFGEIIKYSHIKEREWESGGSFSGLTSGSGFRRAVEKITGE
jgi:DGQHR domain-containing protein